MKYLKLFENINIFDDDNWDEDEFDFTTHEKIRTKKISTLRYILSTMKNEEILQEISNINRNKRLFNKDWFNESANKTIKLLKTELKYRKLYLNE